QQPGGETPPYSSYGAMIVDHLASPAVAGFSVIHDPGSRHQARQGTRPTRPDIIPDACGCRELCHAPEQHLSWAEPHHHRPELAQHANTTESPELHQYQVTRAPRQSWHGTGPQARRPTRQARAVNQRNLSQGRPAMDPALIAVIGTLG